MKKSVIGIVSVVLLSLLMFCAKVPESGIYFEFFDREVRPQDNLFLYVNGTWLKETPIPADKSDYGTFAELADRVDRQIKEIIDQLAAGSHEAGTEEQKIVDLYLSYMDTTLLEQKKLIPLEGEFKKILDVGNRDELAGLIAYLRRLGVQTPFSSYVRIDDKNPSRYIVSISQSGLGLPDRDYYLDERFAQINQEYQKYIMRLLELAGISNAEKKAGEIYQLEKNLAKNHWTRVENRDAEKRYNKLGIKELEKLSPDFNWQRFMIEGGLGNEKELLVSQPSYLQAFSGIWKKTSLNTWKYYFIYKLLNEFAPYLNKDFADLQFDFYGKKLRGIQEDKPRWKKGIELVNSSLGMLVGKKYVEKYFPPEAKERMKELVENLRKAYAERIMKLDWMGEETKKQALEKLQAFNPKIGYPDKWKDYSGLVISRNDLVQNLKNIAAFEYEYNINKLGKPIDKTEWFMNPQTVNAYYSSTMNEVVFPAGILQPPFFNLQADEAINYGAIGAVIGHEMTHGFDDQGSKYDAAGQLREWWTEQDRTEFIRRGQLLVEQYNQFMPFPGEDYHVNGQLTLGENIADLGGLTIAYYAYKLSLGNEKSPVIDGFTGEQRFFIGWAQIWRRKYTREELIRRLKTDPHSPSEYRVNGVVRNMPEFYEAFQVKEGDQLYLPPEQRVQIW